MIVTSKTFSSPIYTEHPQTLEQLYNQSGITDRSQPIQIHNKQSNS